MISVSKLLCDLDAEGDGLRYDAAEESDADQIRERKQRRPVVVWNLTKQCNLYCEHCYAAATDERALGELSTAEGKRLLDDLAGYGVPVDGLRERNNAFRGQEGAFDAAVRRIEACLDAGLKTGLRYTITDRTAPDLEDVVDFLYDVGVDRFCFYHLDYGGRGAAIRDADLDPEEKRRAVRRVCDMTREYHDRDEEMETLLVGNYCDAAYLVEYAREEFGPDTAERIRRYLRRNGGDPAGERVADVDYQGNVHLTQFWQGYSLGNVRDRPFGAIWEDDSNPLLRALREREDHLTGKCADCRYRDVCRGASRLRSLAAHDHPFGPDPQCYLSEAEVSGSEVEIRG